MKRRHALTAMLSALLWPSGILAQRQPMPVIGVLVTHPPLTDPIFDWLRASLKKFGHVDGKNIKLELRTALGRLEHVAALAEELVRLPVDIVVVAKEVAVRAVTQATRTIPIVLVGYTNDPLALGWIESYRRPGGNLTGVFGVDLALGAKRLEILKETLPGISRVAVLWDPDFGRRELEEIRRAALVLHVEIEPIEVRRTEDLITAAQTVQQKKVGAFMLTWSPVFYTHRKQVAEIARTTGLPAIGPTAALAEAGVLLAYGSDNRYNWGRVGYFVDRLLKGARAAELPVEQASRFKLVVNLKTAKTLGIRIPESVLMRADEVIR